MGKRDQGRRWPPGVDEEIAASLDRGGRRALRRLARRDASLALALAEAERRRRRLSEAVAAGRKGRKRRRRLGAAEADVRAAAEDVLEASRSISGPAAAYVWPSVAMAEGALAQLGESSLLQADAGEDHADIASTLADDAAESIDSAEAAEQAAYADEPDESQATAEPEAAPGPEQLTAPDATAEPEQVAESGLPTGPEPEGHEWPTDVGSPEITEAEPAVAELPETTEPEPAVAEPAPATEPGPGPAVFEPAVPGRTIAAAIDAGSNSVHLLVASLEDHRIEPLVDESVFLGLGRAADAGALGPELRAELAAALARYVDAARELGATSIAIVGTEPLRRSSDAARAIADVELASGVPVHVLGHEEEAFLTLLGATEGRPVTSELGVIDVGGGSSELVLVSPGRRASAFGLPVGSARLTDGYLSDDPPTPGEIETLRAVVRERLATGPVAAMTDLVAVGGTADNLVRIVPAASTDRILTPRRLEDALAVLMAEPAASFAERHAIRPERARMLPAGAVILAMLLEHYGLDRLTASGSGLREGLVRALVHAGASWRDRLEPLAHGWVE